MGAHQASRRLEGDDAMQAVTGDRRIFWRGPATIAVVLSGLALAACQTGGPAGELTKIDTAQSSSENIASLSAVIARNPQDPEAYNVRGSAYGRGGKYREALQDFDAAIQLRPNFYQAYANRALIHRFMGNQANALSDYNRAVQLNPNYDAAYIGRGNLYRKAG